MERWKVAEVCGGGGKWRRWREEELGFGGGGKLRTVVFQVRCLALIFASNISGGQNRQDGCQTVREEGRAPARSTGRLPMAEVAGRLVLGMSAIVAPPLLPAPIVSIGGTAHSTALECIAVEVIDQARRSTRWATGVATARILCSS